MRGRLGAVKDAGSWFGAVPSCNLRGDNAVLGASAATFGEITQFWSAEGSVISPKVVPGIGYTTLSPRKLSAAARTASAHDEGRHYPPEATDSLVTNKGTQRFDPLVKGI